MYVLYTIYENVIFVSQKIKFGSFKKKSTAVK